MSEEEQEIEEKELEEQENQDENIEENNEENLNENENKENKQEENGNEIQENEIQNDNIENKNDNLNIKEEEKNNEDNKENYNNIEEKEEEKEIKSINNSELTNIIKVNPQAEKEEELLLRKEINGLNIKKQNNWNIIHAKDISFSKKGFFEDNNEINNHIQNNNFNNSITYNNNAYKNNKYFYNNINYDNYNYNNYHNIFNNNYISKKNSQQLLREINNDMDILSNDLKPIFKNYQIKQRIKFSNNSYNYPFYKNNNENGYSNNDFNDEFDEQDKEIKNLIRKANNSLNNRYRYKSYYNNNERYSYRNKRDNLNNYYRMENEENFNDYYSDTINGYENSYIKNISLEKNINKNRIKKMENIYENTDSYINEPMIYHQRETFPIKNSFINEPLGLPQTSRKIEYLKGRSNLVFSSKKIPFKTKKFGNISHSIDLLFSE